MNPSLKTLHQLFYLAEDIKFQKYTFKNLNVHVIRCEGMVDQQLLQEAVISRLQALQVEVSPLSIATLPLPELIQVKNKEQAISLVFRGFVLLYFEQQDQLYASNCAKKPNRSPEETKLEVIVKGPRDNFIEDIVTNIALIRKRLPTNSLCVHKLEIGRRSKTAVAILYMDDIADPQILQVLKGRLNEIDTDVIVSADLLMEHVNEEVKLIPRTDYTARPDFAIQSLIVGRYVILVDGVAYGVITPINLMLLIKTSEDNGYPPAFASFERLMRLTGVLVGVLLPAFWLALTTFHQEQLPFQLLATVVIANRGLPLPSALEMIIMILMFELFREAGLRLPSAIGGTFSVVGGLIIGDAAIRAGVTSPAMIVVIAISTIATYTLVNQSLATAAGLLRLMFVLVTAGLGLFGFFIMLYFTLTHLANLRIFGVPFLNISADLSPESMKKSFIRQSARNDQERAKLLNPTDKTRGNQDE